MEVLNFPIYSSIFASLSPSTFSFSSRYHSPPQPPHPHHLLFPRSSPSLYTFSCRQRLYRINSLGKKLSQILHRRHIPSSPTTEGSIHVSDVHSFDFKQRNDIKSKVSRHPFNPNSDEKSKNTTIDVDFRVPMNNGEISAKSCCQFTETNDEGSKNSIERASDADLKCKSSVEVAASAGKHGIFTHGFVPKLGMVILCSCFLLWTANLLLKRDEGGGKKLNSFEEEIVRRKMKAMTEKEILQTTGVEIVHHAHPATVKSITRPQIDKRGLFKTISRAKMGSDPFNLEDGGDLGLPRSPNENQNVNDSYPALIGAEEGGGDHSGIVAMYGETEGARERTTGSADLALSSVEKNSSGIPIGGPEGSQDVEVIAMGSTTVEDTKLGRQWPVIDPSEPDMSGKQRQKNAVGSVADAMEDTVNGNEGSHSKHEQNMDGNDSLIQKYLQGHSIAKKISICFKNSYELAIKRVKEGSNNCYTFDEIRSILYRGGDDGEENGVDDQYFKGIVSKVKENNLAGRDPFHAINPDDKTKFFIHIDKQINKIDAESLMVYEFLLTNIANLGKEDCVGDDSMMPYWSGEGSASDGYELLAVLEKRREELGEMDQLLLKAVRETKSEKHERDEGGERSGRTVIEGSDGSSRRGKKSGKEYWEHTKKWSRGFWEVYNSQTDPEIKSALRDTGKDLDKWMTEEEMEKMMDVTPDVRDKDLLDQNLHKIRRETMMFGTQAVFNKYREYDRDEEQEHDPLWWLDLPHLNCIEVNTEKKGGRSMELYSLMMAPDLDLTPRPHHVIAFENLEDANNFCHIMVAHKPQLGTRFVTLISFPPKDVYREARAKGLRVTVIKKGELELDMKATLKEAESEIVCIGSQPYHDKSFADKTITLHSLLRGALSP